MSGKTNIQVDFLGKGRLEKLGTMEKVRLIIDRVKENKIVVLEEGLSSDEQATLVETTMGEISTHEDGEFSGLEIETRKRNNSSSGLRSKLSQLASPDNEPLMIVGPANKLKTIDEDDTLSAIIKQ